MFSRNFLADPMCVAIPLWTGLVLLAQTALVEAQDPATVEFFEAKIRPVLVQHCYECHSKEAKSVKGGLLLDHREGLRSGGDLGPAVVLNRSGESLLIAALRYESLQMPPKGKLPASVIEDFVRWVDAGAVDPREGVPAPERPMIDFAKARQFWSFVPPRMPPRPAVQAGQWPRGPIDYFTLAAMEARGLRPVGPAEKRALIRRATFDLLGLPPTPAEVAAFLADESIDAFAKVVDRLLSSSHYGERWGRYWLDVARYSEDQAHTFAVTPNTSGYRYRDWVVRSLNADLPYDQFVRLQIAGDLIALEEPARFDQLAALGYFGLGAQYYKNTDAAKAAADELDDRIDTLTRGFLGLTVSCARCHDHKFDPIPQQDYYSLAGVFQSSRLQNLPLVPQAVVDAYQQGQQQIKEREEELKQLVAKELPKVRERRVAEVATYMQAVWRYLQARRTDPSRRVAEFAKSEKLDEKSLQRWIELLDAKQKGQIPQLQAWFELLTAAESGLTNAAANASVNAVGPTPVNASVQHAAVQTNATGAPATTSVAVTAAETTPAAVATKPDPNADASDQAAAVPDAVASVAERFQQRLERLLKQRDGTLSQEELAALQAETPEGNARYISPLVTKSAPLVEISVDLKGARELHLVVTDGGNGASCDHADWVEPRLVTAEGETKLTDLKWRSVTATYGQINVNANVNGQPLRIAGKPYAYGLGTHSTSVIVYDLPAGAKQFRAGAGLDNSGTDQGGDCGASAQVQFRVYTETPTDLTVGQPDLLARILGEKGPFAVEAAQAEKLLSAEVQQTLQERRQELDTMRKNAPAMYPIAHAITEANVADMKVFLRGNPANVGDVAPRRFLKVLAGEDPPRFQQGSGRLELADAIVSSENPLAARVMVNRIWQHHFGRGLVGTPDNFGALGEPPTHPELLDYLARRFIESGWSIKAMHREIMLSATYQLSTERDESNRQIDADNRYLWRMNRRRLDVESWRDALLTVSGRLDPRLDGPSTNLADAQNVRRTIYGKISRHELDNMLRLFDFPDANITSSARVETTVPQQQLFVLNSPFIIEQAKAFAARLQKEIPASPSDRINRAFELAYGRSVTDEERQMAETYLQLPDDPAGAPENKLNRWERLAQVLLGSNEFLYLD
jgi:cytochrome c553